MRRRLLLAIAAGSFVLVATPLMARRLGNAYPRSGLRPPEGALPALAHSVVVTREDKPSEPQTSPIAGLDLTRIASVDGSTTAPAEKGTARLTIDAELQRTTVALMAARRLPEAAAVVIDVASGRLLVYASHLERGPARDLCAEATAPSASVFKIVTAAALVEDAGLNPETRQCYLGGEQRILPIDLVDDPQRDRWCTTLAGAMGRSINTVFARLASEHLTPEQVASMARRFGYGQPLLFDVPVQPSALHIPSDSLEFARTAAGFWNTTLSPLEAAEISAIVARGGASVRPSVVDKVVDPSGAVVWMAPETSASTRAIAQETAEKLGAMMEHTVTEGTSWRAFHDARGLAFLPGIAVAGKTGTLTDGSAHRYFTWFTGFAPMTPIPGARQVAIGVLVVNGPTWQIKANVLAREVLRSYFASREVQGVTRPSVGAIARHKHER